MRPGLARVVSWSWTGFGMCKGGARNANDTREDMRSLVEDDRGAASGVPAWYHPGIG